MPSHGLRHWTARMKSLNRNKRVSDKQWHFFLISINVGVQVIDPLTQFNEALVNQAKQDHTCIRFSWHVIKVLLSKCDCLFRILRCVKYRCMFVTNVSYESLLMWKSVRDAPKSVEELHRIAASYFILKNYTFYIL